MARNFRRMQGACARALLTTMVLLVNAAFAQAAIAADQARPNDYTWSAELVSFDQASRVVTLKSLIVDPEMAILGELKAGDRVTVTWSGITWGAGVLDISRDESGSSDALVLPIEFVRTELDDRYLVYRLPIPMDSVSRISGLTAGDWVTATAARGASDWNQAVKAIRPYNDIG